MRRLAVGGYLCLFLLGSGLDGRANTSWPSALLASQRAPGLSSSDCWTAIPSPVDLDHVVQVQAWASLAPDDIWIAGGSSEVRYPEATDLLVARWNGVGWTALPDPAPQDQGIFNGLAVLASNDLWAAGDHLAHWDGQSWRLFAIPSPPGLTTVLESIAAVSSNDIWAVGTAHTPQDYYEPEMYQAVVIHWNGTAWTALPLSSPAPSDPADQSELHGVVASAPNDVWAVGDVLSPGRSRPLLAHWEGRAWSLGLLPDSITDGALESLAAITPRDIWALGIDLTGVLSIHWDGTLWRQVANLKLSYVGDPQIYRAAAGGPDNIWAAGGVTPLPTQTGATSAPFLLHWDGVAWRERPLPTSEDSSKISGLMVGVGGDLWISGYGNQPGNSHAFILHYTSTMCPPSALPAGSAGFRFFDQTGRTVSGRLLDYWQTHGGLVQQGYPLSDPIGEVSAQNGKPYTVQYFERAVFEYHPENTPPYDVLLSLLGVDAYQQRYGDAGAPDQHASTDHPRYFPETGYTLGGVFRTYWETHGGLAQQGYPISDEFTEVSALDGQPYTVQYFQRAVFEYHPENAGTPYEVLLSQLGRLRYMALYPAQP